MVQVTDRDKTQEIIDIAKRVQQGGVNPDNFQTVFDAIIRAEFPEERTLVISPPEMSSEQARALVESISRNLGLASVRLPKRYD